MEFDENNEEFEGKVTRNLKENTYEIFYSGKITNIAPKIYTTITL
jgi:hypothetical protein